jgi:CDP-paratose 2-epimerase
MITCSAEPSVVVEMKGDDTRYQLNNNLFGTINCFKLARMQRIPVIFLSTSRAYPHTAVNGLKFHEPATRLEYADHQPGVSGNVAGIFTALTSECLRQEYSGQYGLPSIINRCDVITGP